MNTSIIPAMSALLGAAIGALASFLASWMTQRMQMRAQWLTQDKLRRQDLYKEFMEEASKCYIDALQHAEGDIPLLVTLYTKIGRIRIVSSPNVIDSAEQIGRKILDTYFEPNRSFLELREMAKKTRSIFFTISPKPAAMSLNHFVRRNCNPSNRQRNTMSTNGTAISQRFADRIAIDHPRHAHVRPGRGDRYAQLRSSFQVTRLPAEMFDSDQGSS